MRRTLARKQAIGVSLFPFLAVLICTMGALVVLLVLVVKKSEAHAQTRQDESQQNQQDLERGLRQQYDDQKFLQDTLAEKRPEITSELTASRMELSHLEDHILQLKKQAEQIEQQLQDLEQVDSLRNQNRESAQNELGQLQRQIQAARDQLADARQRAANKPRSFSIIVERGPNGTLRRPIYVECTDRGVILQPEGIVLRPGDFAEPLIPGNPLDAALLAVREYLARSGAIGKGEEPYPLLIVRPDGAEAYARARAAMKSWDDEFGYELIDDKMKLEYPKADPVLAQTIRDAIELSRRRQAALAKAQPTRFGGANGGIASEDNGGVLRTRPGGGGFVREGGGGDDPWFDGTGKQREFGGSSGQGESDDQAGNANAGQSQGDSQSEDGRQPSGQTQSTGETQSSNGSQPGGSRAQNGGGSSNPASFGGSQENLADSRGENWGLKNYSPSAHAYTRPIRVVCSADRLKLIPQPGTGEKTYIIPLQGATIHSIDKFMSSVHTQMESWGIAGRNAYWKPVVSVEVTRGGEQRYAELESLLRGSGLEVKRKSGT